MKSPSLLVMVLVVLIEFVFPLQSQAKEIGIGSVNDIQDYQIIVTVSDLEGFRVPPDVANWKWFQLQQTGAVIVSIESREMAFNLYLSPEGWHQFKKLVNQADKKISLLSQLKRVPSQPQTSNQNKALPSPDGYSSNFHSLRSFSNQVVPFCQLCYFPSSALNKVQA